MLLISLNTHTPQILSHLLLITLLCGCGGAGVRAWRTKQLWEEFFSDPSQWWDHRNNKRNPRFPDFKHRSTGMKALWIDDRFTPPWVRARLPVTVQGQEQGQFSFLKPETSVKVVRVEQLWQKVFSDPSEWWANRFIKTNQKYPDFEHKSTHEGLWIEGRLNNPRATAKVATMTVGQTQSGGGLKLWVANSLGNGGNVSKLCQEGRLKEALHMLELMVQANIQAPINIYACLLKGCTRRKALAEGKQVHALIVQQRLDSNMILGNTLVNMYAKCGSVLDARKVFDSMPRRNVFSWTTIISAYANHRQGEEAINLFQQMQQTGIAPDKFAFVVVLKACTRISALEQGKQLHLDIIESGYESDVIVGSTLVDMYAKCGRIEDARKVFDSMHEPDVVSWTAIIAGYARQGLGKEALDLYEQMNQEDLQPDIVTYIVLLQACASIAALEQGKQLHVDIIKIGFELDVIIGSTLVDMYAKCGRVEDACRVFNNMPERNIVSWNAMFAGYADQGLGKESLDLYEQMKQEGVQPSIVTYVVLLKACASVAALEQGKQFHSEIVETGFELDAILGSTLVDMYAKCGCIENAHKVFDRMHEREVVSWNAMISGYAQQGLGKEALDLYEQMKEEGVQPDNVTYVVLLKACASIAALEQGKKLHSDIIKSGFESDVIVGSTLVDMYAKCGRIEDARQVFNNMHEQDLVSWTAIIAGYAQQGLGKEALDLYERMKHEGVQPDIVTYVVLLKACGSIAALEQGKQLHSDIIKRGFESDVIVGSTLVDMYAKCGCIEDARQVFNNMHERNVVSWNAIIAGYAQQGLSKEALILLEQMQREGLKPDDVTYVSVLSACSHSGLVNKGRHLFDSMCKDHGVLPAIDHYVCMVDLLGRAGFLADAEDFITKMPIQPTAVVWMTLLGAATTHDHVEIGRRAFDHVIKLEPENAAPYVLLSNIYAAASQRDDVAKQR
ncbi:hypothetical protein O6H91_Y035300 [Diphasiastrum complanatum]|nr:hypothetical protein O6H91_Y035300 [Diphasiastrum complanatum]